MLNNLLEVNKLKIIFYTNYGILNAVNNISFNLKAGETLGIVGESGSGKSVTCLSILKLIPKPSGEIKNGDIFFDNQNILKLSEKEMQKIRGSKISMIFQDPMSSLNPFLKISTQLTEHLILHKNISKKEALDYAINMLKEVGIQNPEKRIFQYPHQFSGGMRQRVMIAMALITNPKLIIADEPTTALDVTIQAQILELLKQFKNKYNLSIILVTHNLGIIAGLADRVIVMYAGYIMEENTIENIFYNPRHPYTKALLKSIPKLQDESKNFYYIPGSPPNLINLPDSCPYYPRCYKAEGICKNKLPPEIKYEDGSRVLCYFPE